MRKCSILIYSKFEHVTRDVIIMEFITENVRIEYLYLTCLLLLNFTTLFHRVKSDNSQTYKNYKIPNMRRYEPVNLIDSIANNGSYFSTKSDKKLDFHFSAFNRHFHVIAHPVSSTTISPDATVCIHNADKGTTMTKITELGIQVYSGWLVGHANSSVFGFFRKEVFQCIIHTEDEVYTMEPSSDYLQNATGFNAIVYKSADASACNSDSCVICANSETFNGSKPEQYRSSPDAKISNGRRICSVEMVGDYSLYRYNNKNEQVVIKEMLQIVIFADLFLSRIDFNRDGLADNVGLKLEKLTLFKNETDASNPFRDTEEENLDAYKLLKTSETYSSNYCLVHFLFFKSFRDRKSVIASFGGYKDEGICMNSRITGRSKNVVITTRKFGYYARSLTEVSFSFLHGVAHLFGAPHDDPDEKIYPKFRRNLMNPYIDTFEAGKTVLSRNSIDCISGLIHKRGSWCLKPDSGPVCGNTITEEGEECDCGSNITCHSIDPNCTPSDDTGEDRPCSIRRSKNKLCSARESICCTEDGLYVTKKEKKLCTSNYNECVLPEFCNGKSEKCPNIDLPRHRSVCAGNSRLCHHGICNGSICWKYNLLECECQEERFACHVCCFHNGVCDALYFQAKTFTVPIYFKKLGEYCLKDTGYCNPDGICIKFSYKLSEASLHQFSAVYFIIIAILIIFCIPMKISFYVTELMMRRSINKFLLTELVKTKDSVARLSMLFPTVSVHLIQVMMNKLDDEDLVVTSLIASGIPMRIEFNKPICVPCEKNYHLIDSTGDSPCDYFGHERLNKALSFRLIEEAPL